MKYLKKLELSDEMFTEEEKKKIEKYYEKTNDSYKSIKYSTKKNNNFSKN